MTDEADVAKLLMASLMKFDPLKPWAEMTDEDKGKFIVLSEWFLFKLKHSPVKGWDDDTQKHLSWPLLVVMLRCHGRPLRNVLTEYETDPEGFLAETDRMRVRWEANLNACAVESGSKVVAEEGDIPMADLRKLFDAMASMLRKKLNRGEEI